MSSSSDVSECPPDKEPFLPLIYLGPEAMEALYPKTLQLIQNDMEGGEVLRQLQNFSNSVRAYLQHYGVFV